MSLWTADPQALEQLKHIFRGSLSINNQERKLANDALDQAKQEPEFENYLFELLVKDTSAKSDVRAAAGINLKNSILKRRQSNRQYLLDNILTGLTSDDSMVRNITGNVITSLFSIYGLEGWPTILPNLLALAKTSTGTGFVPQEAAMSALSKICEDSYSQLDVEFQGERPLNFLLASFLELLSHPSDKIKANAIHCVNQFVPLNTQSFLVIIDAYLTKLFSLAQDGGSNEVRKNICSSFLLILESRPDKLMPHLDGVINYCLHLMQENTSEEVSLEACEFLLALSTASEQDKELFKPKLSLILPILLDKMVYSEEEIFLMEIADTRDNADVADKDEDIKPQNAKGKDARTSNNNSVNGSANGTKNPSPDYDSDVEDDEDDEESEIDQWSLRKCSAATLDVLSENFPGEVLMVTLPILQEKIVSPEWPVREAAILAFGAISASCIELARDKLPSLVPFLVDRLQDEQPRVRQITCWTLSRYVSWVSEEAHDGGEYANYFQPTFQSIVACALDKKKVVQEAACSALSAFIEESDSSLIEFYLEPLLAHFAKCFETYQRKNLIILYDCIQTFVEKMGYENLSSNPEYMNTLLPPLLRKWEILDDNDTGLWPLLECMASIAATLRELFAPFAVPVYERAIKILSNCIQLDQQCQTDPSIEAPEKDFMVTSLDLIDGLIQGFEQHSVDLIQQQPAHNLMELLMLCFEDYNADVRQSAYALLGDLAIFVLDPIVKPYLHSILLSIGNEINNRSYSSYPVYNNAIWALGEIVIRTTFEEVKPYLSNLADLLIPVLNSTDTQSTVLENAAICLGRMGLTPGGAATVAPRLAEFIVSWCSHFLYLVDNNEKETGFHGMINIIGVNPDQGFGGLSNQQGKKNLAILITCIGNYQSPTQELQHLFTDLISNYRVLLGEEVWQSQVLTHIDPEVRNRLQVVYGA